MNLGRTVVAVSVDHDRLFALGATVGSDRVTVKTQLSERIPDNVDERDPAVFGKWMGEKLRAAGLGRSRLVFAATRGEVVLKRLRLPRPEGGESDLAGMVRLQMARQLTLALDGTAIDYVLLGEEGPNAGESGHVSVLAGALPGDRVGWYRQVTRSAGCRLERIGLLASGTAAILASVSQRHSGPVLGIAAGPSSLEFVVVQDGHLAFARAADMSGDEDSADSEAAQEALVQRAAVEAKRTWMSYRVGQDSAEIDAVVVPGEGDLARQIGRRCGDALEMQWRLAVLPSNVTMPEEMPEDQRLLAASLAGLLGERILARRTLDFAHPRKTPDLAARKRQRVLLAALVLLGVGGAGFLYSNYELSQLKRQRDEAKQYGADLRQQQREFLREQARLGHVQAWRQAGIDWISHANWITEQMPDTRQARLESIEGRFEGGVEYTGRGNTYNHEGWSITPEGRITISGRINERQGESRDAVNQLRSRLVDSPVYQRVATPGPDVPRTFTLNLATLHRSPQDVLAKEERGSGKGKEQ